MNRPSLSILLVSALLTPLYAQTSADLEALRTEKATLQADIKKYDARIATTDSAARSEQKRSAELATRFQADLVRRQTEIDSLDVRLVSQAKELQKERARISNMELQIQNADAGRKALAKDLAQATARLESVVSQTLPWERDQRLERIRALRRDLENGAASPDEGFSRLRALYAEEIRFGDEVVLTKKPVTRNDGETVNARVLRIGNQWMVYADEDSKRFGILERTLSGDSLQFHWREDLSFDERQAVLTALDVKDAKKPPQLVALPLTLSVPAATNAKSDSAMEAKP